MKVKTKATATSGATKTAVTLVSRVINTAIKAADAAAAKKSHAIAYGLAYLMHFCKLTLDEATKQVLAEFQLKFPKTSRGNIKSFNYLIPVALEMVRESKQGDCHKKGKNGKVIGLAIPAAGLWPNSQAARDVLAVAGLTPVQAMKSKKAFSLLTKEAATAAAKRVKANHISAGTDPKDIKAPDAKTIAKSIKAKAAEVRSDAKDKETKAAEAQTVNSAEFAESYILAHRGEWSSEVKAALSALLSE